MKKSELDSLKENLKKYKVLNQGEAKKAIQRILEEIQNDLDFGDYQLD